MHPKFLGTLLGASLIIHCALHPANAATITSAENLSSGTDREPERNVVDPNAEGKWDADLELLTSYLEQVLREGELWDTPQTPLLYVEDASAPISSERSEEDDISAIPWKRSRYYRRYPWKRQNGRHRTQYADSSRYMCNPTREDVFQLLVALHEAREGNTRRIVNFCNRKRPASTIFTNIRFLGRRK